VLIEDEFASLVLVNYLKAIIGRDLKSLDQGAMQAVGQRLKVFRTLAFEQGNANVWHDRLSTSVG
jgi:hypothetical protein